MEQKFEVAVNLAQDFTDEQKAQARSNIDAGPELGFAFVGDIRSGVTWGKICELTLADLSGYTSYMMSILLSADGSYSPLENGIFTLCAGSYRQRVQNFTNCNGAWLSYLGNEAQQILGIKTIGKYGRPAQYPLYAANPLYKVEVWGKFDESQNGPIHIKALQNSRFNLFFSGVQDGFVFANGEITLTSTEPHYDDDADYIYKDTWYEAKNPYALAQSI